MSIPEGYHTVTPGFVVNDAAAAIEFYKKALGAEELLRMRTPDGRVMHAELRIGNSIVFLGDEFPEMGSCISPKALGGSTFTLHLYVEDVDSAYRQALAAGGKSRLEPTNMFWGDRYSQFEDPWGHRWGLATQIEKLTPQEIEKRQAEWMAGMGRKEGAA